LEYAGHACAGREERQRPCCHGIANWYTNGQQIVGNLPDGFIAISNTTVLGVPLPAIYVALDSRSVNLRAVFLFCQTFGRQMVQQGHGKIINIASLQSVQGGITIPTYTASKHAIAGLTKSLCNEWASQGVNVNAIAPGYMDTDLNSALLANPVRERQISERIPAGRWGTPEDMAGAVVFLASPASDYLHGHMLVVDGGWLAR